MNLVTNHDFDLFNFIDFVSGNPLPYIIDDAITTEVVPSVGVNVVQGTNSLIFLHKFNNCKYNVKCELLSDDRQVCIIHTKCKTCQSLQNV